MPEAESGAADPKQDLLAARAGDQRAASDLIRTHGASMLRTAWRVLGRHGDSAAEDVVQEAFIAALSTPALPVGEVGAWLRAITARKALDWLRGESRRGEVPLPHGPRPGVAEGGRRDRALDVVILREGLSRLPAADRAILTLVDLEGWSMTEAARMLRLSHVAVRLRASRARRRLARYVRGEGGKRHE